MMFDIKDLQPGLSYSIQGRIIGTPGDGYLAFNEYAELGTLPEGWSDICPAVATFTLPKSYNPAKAVHESIAAAKAKALEDYEATIKRLCDLASKWLALENSA